MDALFKCPKCNATEMLEVSEKGCLAFHKCKSCSELIGTPKGQCCVICTYTDRKCPVSIIGSD